MRPRAGLFGGSRQADGAEQIVSALAWATRGNPWALGAVVLSVLMIGGGLYLYFATAPEWNEADFKLTCREMLGEPLSEAWERLDGERTFLSGCVSDSCRDLSLGGEQVQISCPDHRCFALFRSAEAVCRLTVDPRLPVVQEVDTFWDELVGPDGLSTP